MERHPAETDADVMARLSRWSVESEHGDLKGLIAECLLRREQDLLRARIAVTIYGKLSQDEFEKLVRELKASNWPQPHALVKVARHVGVFPAQTRGIRQAPLWLIVKEHVHTPVLLGEDRLETKRHVVNLVTILEADRAMLDGAAFVGKKAGCGKVFAATTGRGKATKKVSFQRLPDGAKTRGLGIEWCDRCQTLYNKPVSR